MHSSHNRQLRGPNPQTFYTIAILQKIVIVILVIKSLLFVLLVNGTVGGTNTSATTFSIVLMFLWIGAEIVAAPPIIALSYMVYRTVGGCMLGILCLIPCLGFILTLVVLRETNVQMQRRGIPVGALGPQLSVVKEKIADPDF